MRFEPPKHDPDLPDHELYAQEGPMKFYRPKKTAETMKLLGAKHKEHEAPYWEGDHS